MRRSAPALMLQGTGSNVGKSLLVAGLCRAFARRGLQRAAVQAAEHEQQCGGDARTAARSAAPRRCRRARAAFAPSVHMNPVLLKPQTEIGAQVIVQGRVFATCTARDYARLKPDLMPYVLESFAQLSRDADLVLAEGAGSPAEVNLREHDIANMGFAEAADLPVVLVGDIDRGGVIAALVGTHALLEPAERARLKGYLINKFRGDPSAVRRGAPDHRRAHRHAQLRRRAVVRPSPPAAGRGRPGTERARGAKHTRAIKIAVPRLARIANFDDLDPLVAEPDVQVQIVPPGAPLPGDADLVILPGSKATLADLAALRARGLGHRSRGARPARRRGARHLRRLADARPAHRRS